MYWSFEYLFSELKRILPCPCKKAVKWSCKIELLLHQGWETRGLWNTYLFVDRFLLLHFSVVKASNHFVSYPTAHVI